MLAQLLLSRRLRLFKTHRNKWVLFLYWCSIKCWRTFWSVLVSSHSWGVVKIQIILKIIIHCIIGCASVFLYYFILEPTWILLFTRFQLLLKQKFSFYDFPGIVFTRLPFPPISVRTTQGQTVRAGVGKKTELLGVSSITSALECR